MAISYIDKRIHLDSTEFYIGIDGGGTKCKAVLIDGQNHILGTGVSGPGNPVHSLQLAKNSIVDSASQALKNAQGSCTALHSLKLSDISVGLGLAGVNIPSYFNEISSWDSPFYSHHLTTDLAIACLGAHKGENGAVIVAGTGSCGFVEVNGVSHTIGAHGFPQGDKGSGAWFGLKAVESTLLFLDDMGPCTTIAKKVFEELKTQDSNQIIAHVASKSSTVFASLAHCVFKAADEEQDGVALTILDEGVSYLEDMANSLLRYNPPRISFLGGLSSTITPHLSARLRHKLSHPVFPPEVGAALFAKNLLEN